MKAICEREGIRISESTLGLVSYNCNVANCIQYHDLGVSEYYGDQDQYQGKEGANATAKLIFAILDFHRRRLAEVIETFYRVTSRVDEILATSLASFRFIAHFSIFSLC